MWNWKRPLPDNITKKQTIIGIVILVVVILVVINNG